MSRPNEFVIVRALEKDEWLSLDRRENRKKSRKRLGEQRQCLKYDEDGVPARDGGQEKLEGEIARRRKR